MCGRKNLRRIYVRDSKRNRNFTHIAEHWALLIQYSSEDVHYAL